MGPLLMAKEVLWRCTRLTLRPPTRVHMFWAYGALSQIEKLAVSSFLANGYAVTVWSYDHIPNVPSEAVLRDAREILPESAVFLNRRGSYAGFSDLFRYAVLRQLGGLYADTDVIALQPSSTLSPRPFLVLEHGNPPTVTGNLIWHPTPTAGDLIDLAFAYAKHFPRRKIAWAEIGPALLTDLATLSPDHGFDIKPPAFANPIGYWDCPRAFLAAGELPDGPFVHLYNEMWRYAGIDKNQQFDAATVIGKLCARFA